MSYTFPFLVYYNFCLIQSLSHRRYRCVNIIFDTYKYIVIGTSFKCMDISHYNYTETCLQLLNILQHKLSKTLRYEALLLIQP
jgi:hypothetical protein